MSSAAPHTLIQDDGELVEIRSLLDDLGVEYVESGKGESAPLPTHLLISSGTHAVATLKRIGREGRDHHFLHLVIIDRASRSLRQMLQRQGCDMIAQQPVHPTVMRLLVQRAHYPGQERREVERVAVGAKIRVRTGLVSRAATLGELSEHGCGLVLAAEPTMGSKLRVTLPGEISGLKSIALTAKVVGTRRLNAASNGQYSVAAVFVGLTRDLRGQLSRIMRERAQGRTGRLKESPGAPARAMQRPVPQPAARNTTANAPKRPAAARTSTSPASGAVDQDRRGSGRRTYDQSVLARSADATHTLLGRDLSVGGMRVCAEQGLEQGAKLQLAIYGTAGIRPVIVTAEVVRDDGSSGLGLRFDELPADAREQLVKIVEDLEELDQSGARTGTVVSEVLDRV